MSAPPITVPCDTCDAQDASLICSGCYQAVYCNASCQRADFADHSPECTTPSEAEFAEIKSELIGLPGKHLRKKAKGKKTKFRSGLK